MYDTFDDMREANREAGQFWFTPDTLAFFDGRLHEPIHPTTHGDYFVSSEQAPASGMPGRTDYYRPDRFYSVRFIDRQGRVHTVGEFQEHDTEADAHSVAASLASSCMIPTDALES